jgi:hypothetical protein
MKLQPGVGYTFDSSSSGFTLDTTDPFPSVQAPVLHPFKVINVVLDESTWLYQVVPGTMNNEVAQIMEDSVWVFTNRTAGGIPDWPVSVLNFTDAKSYIYLRAGVDQTNDAFPGQTDDEDEWPRIISSGTVLTDTDDYGYILLAMATEGPGPVCTVVQYVTGSLWADRIKLGTLTAKYYYART